MIMAKSLGLLLALVCFAALLGCDGAPNSPSSSPVLSDYIIGSWIIVADDELEGSAAAALRITENSCTTIMGSEQYTVNYEIISEIDNELLVAEWVGGSDGDKNEARYMIEDGRLYKEMFESKVELVKGEGR